MGGKRTLKLTGPDVIGTMIRMSYEPRSSGKAFGLSVLIGAFGGISLHLLVTALDAPIDVSELWAVPVLILVYGLFALPFVAVGLALFGLPVTALLRGRAQAWWVGLIAALWGTVAGKLMFYVIDSVLFFGSYKFLHISLTDLGIIFGVPTASAWWLLHCRELASG